jgi:hypothetical protein
MVFNQPCPAAEIEDALSLSADNRVIKLGDASSVVSHSDATERETINQGASRHGGTLRCSQRPAPTRRSEVRAPVPFLECPVSAGDKWRRLEVSTEMPRLNPEARRRDFQEQQARELGLPKNI